MPDQPTDPMQWLAGLYQAGQDAMRQFVPPGSDAAPDPYAQIAAISKGMLEMQQNYLRQMSSLWLGAVATAGQAGGQRQATSDSPARRGATTRASSF